jgi:hypothetical protein
VKSLALFAALAFALSGCNTAMSQYEPMTGVPGELTLRYRSGFEIWSGSAPVARGVSYNHLTDFVRCVPRARSHAEEAERYGDAAVGLSTAGAGMAIGGIGGLGGLAYLDKDGGLAAGIVLTGIGVQVMGVILATFGHSFKEMANGNAVDAVNHYNDAVGSHGGHCRGDTIVMPPREATLPASAPARAEVDVITPAP